MHVAGNDANFPLRALLMLSIRNLDMAQCSEEHLTAVETIKAIAKFSRPENEIEKKEKVTHRQRLKRAGKKMKNYARAPSRSQSRLPHYSIRSIHYLSQVASAFE